MAICTRCGEDNPGAARFCRGCGEALASEVSEARRIVTVVFSDLSDSTSLGEQLDVEPLHHVLARYYEVASRVLERHGGLVQKFIGDAVVAAFGVRVTEEDDALRAVAAALELKTALATLNVELTRDYGVQLDVRIGVNTGEVMVGSVAGGQTLVLGDAMNVAARLQQVAGGGDILIGHTTYQLVRNAVTVESIAPLDLKGKRLPVPAWRLLHLDPAGAQRGRLDRPMVGRDLELSLLSLAYQRVVLEAACHVVTVHGDTGVGKTRLVNEFTHGIDEQAIVLSGRCACYAGDQDGLEPIRHAVAAVAGIGVAGDSDQAVQRLAALAGAHEQAATLVAWFRDHRAGRWQPELIDPVLCQIFGRVAADRPLVLVIDDLHWSQLPLLKFLNNLATQALRESRILLVCLARSEFFDAHMSWAGGVPDAVSVYLPPLTMTQTQQLVAQLLPHGELPADTCKRIAAAAEGNPLIAQALVARLKEQGQLRLQAGSWALAGRVDPRSPDIDALIHALLDHLPAAEREVLERAAVIGTPCTAGELLALSSQGDETLITTLIAQLVRKRLLRADSGAPVLLNIEDARVGFRRPLVREVAYHGLAKAARAELHERYARLLQAQPNGSSQAVAHHLEQASRYRAELGNPHRPPRPAE